MGRTVKSWSVDTNASQATAFEYLADVSRHAEWSPKSYRAEMTSEGPVRPGSTFRSFGALPGDKEHANDVEVTVLDAPRILVLTSTDKSDQFINTFDVESVGEGSRITRTMDSPNPTGLLRLVFPLIFALVIQPDVKKGLRNLQVKLNALAS
jgi:uncharacterized protein YndB with AHSA1/START domain